MCVMDHLVIDRRVIRLVGLCVMGLGVVGWRVKCHIIMIDCGWNSCCYLLLNFSPILPSKLRLNV